MRECGGSEVARRHEACGALYIASFATACWLAGASALAAAQDGLPANQVEAQGNVRPSTALAEPTGHSAGEGEGSEADGVAPPSPEVVASRSVEAGVVQPSKARPTNGTTVTNAEASSENTSKGKKGNALMSAYLEARCLTALCFDANQSENWLGIEPLFELPLGKASAVGRSSLKDHMNSHGLRVELAAGVRVWFFGDLVSLSIYLSTPLSDDPVRLEGIPTTFPSTSIRRPYPGIALGIMYDLLWIGLDYDELRNGDGLDASAYSPLYPPNDVISSAAVITVAIQPVTAVRSVVGLLAVKKSPN